MTRSQSVATSPTTRASAPTSTLPLLEQLVPLLLNAIAAGYRHFDTATLYRTEESVGRAEALQRGLMKRRDEVFVTSKLRCDDAHHHLLLPALQQTLRSRCGGVCVPAVLGRGRSRAGRRRRKLFGVFGAAEKVFLPQIDDRLDRHLRLLVKWK